MNKSWKTALFAAAVQILGGCVSNLSAPEPAQSHRMDAAATPPAAAASPASALRAEAVLRDGSGAQIGAARFVEDATGVVRVTVHAAGVTPGLHGLHLHAVGVCDAATTPAFASAGGHFNPTGKQHGHHNPQGHHAGDLPNLIANEAGVGRLGARLETLVLADLFDADGTALVLHQNEDDLRTDTGPLGPGNSGARIACGVVERR